MTKMIRGAAVAFSLAAAFMATGCGQSICERAETVNKELESKKGDCENITLTSKPKAVCEAALASCTDADQDKMNAMADCMEAIPTCEKGKEESWFAELVKCSEKASGMSEACSKAQNPQ